MKRKNQKDLLTDIAELQGRPADATPEQFTVENDSNPQRNKYAAKDSGKPALTGKTPRRNKIPTKPPEPMTTK